MTTSILWIAFATGTVPAAGLSSEDFDKYFADTQRARNECGPASVYYCLRRLGRATTIEDVKRQIEIGEDGASLQSLLDVLNGYGLSSRALRTDSRDIHLLPCPCILIIGRQHCVVLEQFEPNGKDATIFEPARRELVTLPLAELKRQWSGEVILFADPGMSISLFLVWVACTIVIVFGLYVTTEWILTCLLCSRFRKAS